MTAELSPRAEPPLPGGPLVAAPTGTIDTARILDELADAVVVADAAGTIRLANAACARMFGYAPVDLVGRSVLTLIPARLQAAHLAGFSRFVRTGRPTVLGGPPMRVAARRADGSELPVELALSTLGDPPGTGPVVVATLRDASERVVLERQAVLSRLLQASVDASPDGVLARSPDQRVRAVNRRFWDLWRLEPESVRAGDAFPAVAAGIVSQLVDPEGFETAIRWGHSQPDQTQVVDVALVDQLVGYPPDPDGRHPSAQTIRDGRSRFAADMPEEFLAATTQDDGHLAVLRALAATSYMAVPLVGLGEILGAVTMVAAGSGRIFGPEDLALVENLATRAATVVAKERRNDSQRRLSHTLQASLLPTEPPALDGLEVAMRDLPGTRGVEIGGDFWDVAGLADGTVALAVGDVEGHDMAAAAAMAQLRSALRALRGRVTTPGELLGALQDASEQLGLERMATACLLRLDPVSGSLSVCSAGHPPPLIVEAGAARYLAVRPVPPLGLAPVTAEVAETVWPPGAALVLFTDGLIETPAAPIREEMDRLLDAASHATDLNPDALADHILTARTGPDRHDDIAVLVARRTIPVEGADRRGPGSV